MLSGLRVVSRAEATSLSIDKTDLEVNEDRSRSRRHRKEEKRRGKRSTPKKGSKRHDDNSSESDDSKTKRISKSGRHKRSKKGRFSDPSSSSNTDSEEASSFSDEVPNDRRSSKSRDLSLAARKSVGLDWMVQPPPTSLKHSEIKIAPQEVHMEEQKMQVNPKELNPYLKDGGEGYPSEDHGPQSIERKKISEAPIIGDGGLSWRLKALKRAKEQAEREGQKLDAVVEERWGSLAEMTVSVSARRAAHAHAHLHAIRDRKRMDISNPEEKGGEKDDDLERIATDRRDYLKDVSSRDKRMKAPNAAESLSWKKRRPSMRVEDQEIFHEAASALNKFQNDGRFLESFNKSQQQQSGVNPKENKLSLLKRTADDGQQIEKAQGDAASSVSPLSTDGMSANQLAAKALQLRLQGKSKEAEALLNQLPNKKSEEEELHGRHQTNKETRTNQPEHHASYKQSLKSIMGDHKSRLGKNDSGDSGLAESILHNKQYNRLTCVDDEYESVGGELITKKKKQKEAKDVHKEAKQAIQAHKRLITQEERCQYCFNNPSRPKHLTISIANFTYLMLPPWEPLADGHCLLVPTQHEGSSRNVDDNVWEELRNYKKCLLQMFAKQDKEVLFMETVINLAKQRRHCLVECIPLPPHVAKQAPLYFKKAIDEAEDEWSQHDAKKLIDTSGKGLRACIPKNFPYFHVEFGLHAGFVHVIDNERDFRSDFGRNVVIGMLKLPEEEMHRRRKQQSHDQQQKAAAEFRRAWDPFDWTKMLD